MAGMEKSCCWEELPKPGRSMATHWKPRGARSLATSVKVRELPPSQWSMTMIGPCEPRRSSDNIPVWMQGMQEI
jgi:hypothetical protein